MTHLSSANFHGWDVEEIQRTFAKVTYFDVSQVAPVVKNPSANAGDTGGANSIPGLGRSPREGNGKPLQNSCLETPIGSGAWRATVHEAGKSQTLQTKQHARAHTHTHLFWYHLAVRETWVLSLGREDPLEKEMATHSSIPAWRIPWTEEPGRSMGSQRVGHDWATSLTQAILRFCKKES